MNRRCISNDEKPPLPDTLEQNKLPLVLNMIKSNFYYHTELKRCYPDAPDEILALYDTVVTNNSSLVRNLFKFNEINVSYAFPPLNGSILHLVVQQEGTMA